MFVTLEISYYPLSNEFENPINEFIDRISANNKIKIQSGTMSSLISGDYSEVTKTITETMGILMEKHPSVFNIKISNSCSIK
jgi:uncharacterized protein YqgV (UPF0045/DUF77 family)